MKPSFWHSLKETKPLAEDRARKGDRGMDVRERLARLKEPLNEGCYRATGGETGPLQSGHGYLRELIDFGAVVFSTASRTGSG